MRIMKLLWRFFSISSIIFVLGFLTYNIWDDPARDALAEKPQFRWLEKRMPEYEKEDLYSANNDVDENRDERSTRDDVPYEEVDAPRKVILERSPTLITPDVNSIVYLEARDGKAELNLHTGRRVEVNSTFSEAKEKVLYKAEEHCVANRSYLINLYYVESCKTHNFSPDGGNNYDLMLTLKNDEQLRFPIRYHEEIIRKMNTIVQN